LRLLDLGTKWSWVNFKSRPLSLVLTVKRLTAVWYLVVSFSRPRRVPRQYKEIMIIFPPKFSDPHGYFSIGMTTARV
jgi:hypothetical protein